MRILPRTLFDLFSLALFLRKASSLGLVLFASHTLNSRFLYFISFIFAPLATLRYRANIDSYDLAGRVEKLGPIFVKFGQTMSSREDVVGLKIASSLKNLQDKLQPFDTKIAKETIEKELGAKLSSIFKKFDDAPIASASISQVYKAVLKNDDVVAVKIRRPLIETRYPKDIRLLYTLANIASLVSSKFKDLRLVESVRIFEQSMNAELNFQTEAAHCSQLYDNFLSDDSVIIPKIYWNFSTEKLLVLEWIDGISIYDKDALREANIDLKLVLQKLSVAFFNQAFRDGFFHADLHPGNILITKDINGNSKVAFVDFGIVSFLEDSDRIAMAEILYCLLHRDYYRVAEIHKEIGFIPEDCNLREFSIACRIVGEPIINQAMNLVSIGHLLENLLKLSTQFGMKPQPSLIMLQKTIIVLEGIGKILAPDVNMWHLAEPWIKKWASKNLGFDAKLVRLLNKFLKGKIKGLI